MAKFTLLEIVQKILSDMDAEEINSIGDTTESTQVASIVEDTFYNIISNRLIPEHQQLIKLTSLSQLARPTHFRYPDNTTKITHVWYDVSDDDSYEYATVEFVEPEEFFRRTDNRSQDYVDVEDVNGGTHLRIQNNKMPDFYTSFDDYNIVMDSYDSSVDTTLTSAKTRAMGTVIPTFQSTNDAYTPDLDDNYFPLLINESKSVAMSILKGAPDPKVEQAARRQRTRVQNDLYNTVRTRGLSKYGR